MKARRSGVTAGKRNGCQLIFAGVLEALISAYGRGVCSRYALGSAGEDLTSTFREINKVRLLVQSMAVRTVNALASNFRALHVVLIS
jgi:hypothetical protein